MIAAAQHELPHIAGYELLRPLARGGMGEVFLARPHGSDQIVALKVLAPESEARFERETQLVEQLSHPCLVRVLAHGTSEDRRYFVMEYVPGRNLRDLLKLGRPLPLPEARVILSAIADALIYLEQQGIVHRDLKPENVLLDEGGRICLTDFGLCVRVDDVGLLTQSNQTVGTYDYMAPEQRARLPIDARTDQYALAVLAFEMLTGRRPLGRFKPASALNPWLSRAVDPILFRGLQEDPDDRYPDTASFAAALLAALRTNPQRRSSLLGVAGMLILIVGGFVFRGSWSVGNEEFRRLPLQPPENEAEPRIEKDGSRADAVRRLVALAEQHGAAHERAQAIAAYSQAIQLAPADPMLLVARAHSYLLLNDSNKALADLEAALKLDANHAPAYVGRGALHLQARRFPEAQTDLTTAIRLDPYNATAYAQRGRLHHQRIEYAAALTDLNRAIELDKQCALAYHFRGLTRQKLNSHELAIQDLQESIRLTPNNPLAHGALAGILVSSPQKELRDIPRGVTHAKMACELSAWSNYPLLRQLATAHAAAGNPEEAVRVCDRALRLRLTEKDRKMVQDARSRYQKAVAPVRTNTP